MNDTVSQSLIEPKTRAASLIGGCVVLLTLIVASAIVFWPHISGNSVFIGDSDRLNSLLNIRMFQVRNLQIQGWIPTWNENMFGGYGVAGLHWMQPNYDPFGYLLALAPADQVFQISGFMAALWIVLAGWSAYLFIFDTVSQRFPAAVGALLYGLSVFSVHRTAQLDSAQLSLILMPVGLLLIRRVRSDNLRANFLGLTSTMAILAFYGFLQEVSYLFILLGSYAVYRSIARSRLDPLPIFLISLAAIFSLVIASPRLINVWLDFQQLERTSSFQQTDFIEVFRFLHEGLFGRFQEERLLVGNGLNLHEGLQLLGSTFAALLIITGLCRPRDGWQFAGSLLICLVLSAAVIYLVPPYLRAASAVMVIFGGRLSAAGTVLIFNTITLVPLMYLLWRCEPYLQLRSAYLRILPRQPRDGDAGFHLLALGMILAAVLVQEVQYIVYLLFGRVDFTHARLSILTVLPASTLVAIFMKELAPTRIAWRFDIRWVTAFFIILGASLLVAWLVRGPWLETAGWIVPRSFNAIAGNKPIPAEVLKTFTAIVFFAGLLWLALAFPKRGLRIAVIFCWGCVVIFEVVIYGWFKYNGPHTYTYPIAFRNNNYFSAPRCTLTPPNENAVKALRERLEVDRFRSVLVADAVQFPAYTEPHIAQFWNLRLLGGYSAGIPIRLGGLPWPKEAHQFRAVRFSSLENLPMQLLAVVNVKYIVSVNHALYFNLPLDTADVAEHRVCPHWDMMPDQISIIENPYPVTPREFFAKEIVPVDDLDAQIGPNSMPRIRSVVEGIDRPQQFNGEGTIRASYFGDYISIEIDAAPHDRFLVLNEMFSPRWRAFAGNTELNVMATNVVMRGVIAPAGVRQIEMRYMPLLSSWQGLSIIFSGVAITLLLSATLHLASHRRARARAKQFGRVLLQ